MREPQANNRSNSAMAIDQTHLQDITRVSANTSIIIQWDTNNVTRYKWDEAQNPWLVVALKCDPLTTAPPIGTANRNNPKYVNIKDFLTLKICSSSVKYFIVRNPERTLQVRSTIVVAKSNLRKSFVR